MFYWGKAYRNEKGRHTCGNIEFNFSIRLIGRKYTSIGSVHTILYIKVSVVIN